MMKSQNSAIGRSHVVWLDVVRFVAMFTVVCCHSADPFNFYPGEPPANIDQILRALLRGVLLPGKDSIRELSRQMM